MTNEPDNLIAQFEADASLFEPDRLRRRMEVLEQLDAWFGDADVQPSAEPNHARIVGRAKALRGELESANAAIYHSIRDQIQQGLSLSQLLQWIQLCGDDQGAPAPGLGYDHLDELISGVLQLREPADVHQPEPEMVFYQPTPVRHILRMIQISGLSESDTLIDLGSGLGHVPILAAILTGARSIGIEVDSAYVASAGDCARNLGLDRVTFIPQNAGDADLSTGTIFYLYTPFTGETLRTALRKLQRESAHRAITVCTLGPCTHAVAKERWLSANAMPDPDRIITFRSRA